MKVEMITTGLLSVNTYFLINEETKTCVLIDGGENYSAVKTTAERLGVTITTELLTHSHFDHSGNAAQLQKDGVKVYASYKDGEKLKKGDDLSFGARKKSGFIPDGVLYDGDDLVLEGIRIKVIATPGHSDGSLVFEVDDLLFTGDTLFSGTFGRTDLKSGNFDDIKNSIKKLFALKGDYKVYPGHGEITTLNKEREENEINLYD